MESRQGAHCQIHLVAGLMVIFLFLSWEMGSLFCCYVGGYPSDDDSARSAVGEADPPPSYEDATRASPRLLVVQIHHSARSAKPYIVYQSEWMSSVDLKLIKHATRGMQKRLLRELGRDRAERGVTFPTVLEARRRENEVIEQWMQQEQKQLAPVMKELLQRRVILLLRAVGGAATKRVYLEAAAA